MINISFLLGESVFTVVWLAIRLAVWIRQGKIDLKRETYMILMYINLAVILRFTFYPLTPVDGKVQPLEFDPGAIFPLRVNIVPIVHILRFGSLRDLLVNLLGNVGLFIPSGIVLPVIYKKLDNFPKTVAAGAFISLCIEILQLPFAARASDIDDIILNTLGCVIGYGIYALCRAIFAKRSRAVK